MLIKWNQTAKRFEPTQRDGGAYSIEFNYPPIPIRSLDFSACMPDMNDGPGSPLGTGETPARALQMLLERLAD